MKTIVIYQSQTGFTKKYAEWIANELKCEILPYKQMSEKEIMAYDYVIYGGRVHAGKVEGLKKVKKLFESNTKAKLIVFATGATPQAAEQTIDTVWKANLSEKELEQIPYFYFQSGLNYEKMKKLDRFIMKVFAKILSNKKNKDSNEIGCENAILNSHDISSKEYIVPLVKHVKEEISKMK
jgi:menaquinone-dependent protoporphyrinogen IX oxidase